MEKVIRKKKKEKSYIFKIKLSAKRKKDITVCAKTKGMSVNRFIKDAINQSLTNYKAQVNESCVPKNQLELFNVDDYFKSGSQLNIEL